jgi:hypothetical protein
VPCPADGPLAWPAARTSSEELAAAEDKTPPADGSCAGLRRPIPASRVTAAARVILAVLAPPATPAAAIPAGPDAASVLPATVLPATVATTGTAQGDFIFIA